MSRRPQADGLGAGDLKGWTGWTAYVGGGNDKTVLVDRGELWIPLEAKTTSSASEYFLFPSFLGLQIATMINSISSFEGATLQANPGLESRKVPQPSPILVQVPHQDV